MKVELDIDRSTPGLASVVVFNEEVEAGIFEAGACDFDAQYATYYPMPGPGGGGGGGGPELPMSIIRLGGSCGRSAAMGCGFTILGGLRGTFTAARYGLQFGGAVGAIGFGAASVIGDCAVGAFTGYMTCHYAT